MPKYRGDKCFKHPPKNQGYYACSNKNEKPFQKYAKETLLIYYKSLIDYATIM